MATCDLPAATAEKSSENSSAAALHQLKELLQGDRTFAQALGTTASTEARGEAACTHR